MALLFAKCERPVCGNTGFIDLHHFAICGECGQEVCLQCATQYDAETATCLCVECAPAEQFTTEELAEVFS